MRHVPLDVVLTEPIPTHTLGELVAKLAIASSRLKRLDVEISEWPRPEDTPLSDYAENRKGLRELVHQAIATDQLRRRLSREIERRFHRQGTPVIP